MSFSNIKPLSNIWTGEKVWRVDRITMYKTLSKKGSLKHKPNTEYVNELHLPSGSSKNMLICVGLRFSPHHLHIPLSWLIFGKIRYVSRFEWATARKRGKELNDESMVFIIQHYSRIVACTGEWITLSQTLGWVCVCLSQLSLEIWP